MSLPTHKYHVTVSDGGVSPQGPLPCGTAGDKGVAQLTFSPLEPAYVYRLEAVTGAGGYDLTDALTPENGALTYEIPTAWTAAGTAAVRLVQLELAEGEERRRRYYPPVFLQFEYRDEGNGAAEAPFCWQEQIARAEELLDELSQQVEVATQETQVHAEAAMGFMVEAQGAAERAVLAAERSETVLAEVETLTGITASIKAIVGVV